MSDGPLLWYLNRGTGVVLLGLLTVVTVLGVLASRSRAGGRLPGFVVPAVHRNLGLLAVALLTVHATTSVLDEYVDIRWWQAYAPIGLSYRPWWLGLGTVASDLVLAVAVSSAARGRLGLNSWRLVHRSSYLAWALGIVHGLGTGTDAGEPWARVVYLASLGAVALAVLARIVGARRRALALPGELAVHADDDCSWTSGGADGR